MPSPAVKGLIGLSACFFALVGTVFSAGYFGTSDVYWSALNTSSNAYEINKAGAKFANYLVDPYLSKNINWWTDSLRRYYSDRSNGRVFSTEFLDLRDGLNNVCNNLYRNKNPEDLFVKSTNYKTYDLLSEDFWTYCSDFRRTPLLVKHNNVMYDSSKIGDRQKNNHLISTDSDVNDRLWKYKHKVFFSRSKEEYRSDAYFAALRLRLDAERDPLSLKTHCGNAFLLKPISNILSSTIDNPAASSVLTFCSLEGI